MELFTECEKCGGTACKGNSHRIYVGLSEQKSQPLCVSIHLHMDEETPQIRIDFAMLNSSFSF